MKKCSKCKTELSLDSFTKNDKKKDGCQAYCINCQAECSKKSYVKNKEKVIERNKKRQYKFRLWWKEYKTQFVCECGESHPACIQFHHINDDKEDNVSSLLVYCNKARVLAEVAKCIPICGNCHAKLHWNES